ncbi:helix-turn-helix transcriptional regulator [Propioniciclava coleopterorum]|uniref:Helix-turn-helix transcriptional regulator n=1 Tax=Propioniciclava coleopterorum TaxID=2714937 RepID=A0A6G7Y7S6_9ACTN|nr:helix-turn-helix transcriptional regulator [Propioniciclava coleopterorum]QIK72681.1 helix-turn-helix transcriptional regulator [Propioniciclava coleopterorum]
MSERLPANLDVDAPLFTVSVAARLADMHPQTLRGYDRLGLVVPVRNRGRGRRYSLRDVARLRHIQHLSQEEGINLEGIRRILALETELDEANAHIDRLISLLEERQLPLAPRTFTVGQGTVHLGRTVRTKPARALTAGD